MSTEKREPAPIVQSDEKTFSMDTPGSGMDEAKWFDEDASKKSEVTDGYE